MALTKAIVKRTPHAIVYTLTEDGNAAAELAIDVPADLIHADSVGPLRNLLQGGGAVDTVEFADQAAARAAMRENCRVSVSQISGGAGEPLNLAMDQDISGAGVGNFELNCTAVKVAANDVGAWLVRIEYVHSLVK